MTKLKGNRKLSPTTNSPTNGSRRESQESTSKSLKGIPDNRWGIFSQTMKLAFGRGREEAAKLAVRLPPFWSNNPGLWFHRIKAAFEIKDITDNYK